MLHCMSTQSCCSRCGSTRLEPGTLRTAGNLYFRPDNARFLTFKTSDVPIHTDMCMDCGLLHITGDVRKAESLLGSRHTSAAPDA